MLTFPPSHSARSLNSSQFCIFTQTKNYGYKFEKRKNDLVEAEESELRLPGTGHAFLQVSPECSLWSIPAR